MATQARASHGTADGGSHGASLGDPVGHAVGDSVRAAQPEGAGEAARGHHDAVPMAVTGVAQTGEPRWQLRLLGAVEAFDGVQRIERFPARAVAALLARLALAPDRAHAREELVELLWPGVALDVGRNRLRQALSTLKSLLEPADQPGASVLQADRLHVRVVPGALGCDVRRFEALARAGHRAQARATYGGELMPGYYDEWIDDERRRLAAVHARLGEAAADAPAPAEAASARPAGMAPGQVAARQAPAAAAAASMAAPGATAVPAVGGAAAGGPAPAPAVPLVPAPPPPAPATERRAAPAADRRARSAPAPAAAPEPAPEPASLRLPAYLTRLFGADLAAARLRALVLSQRLVTLLGPGGSGKTRLAVEVAAALREGPAWQPQPPAGQPGGAGGPPASLAGSGRFDSVAFVPLVNCSRRVEMGEAIAAALRLPGSGAGSAAAAGASAGSAGTDAAQTERLTRALGGRRTLLVLDNLEQLVGPAGPLLADLLAQVPGLHLLVTSRHALELDGERCVQVEPLALPDPDASLERAAANPAVALFVDRARAARADFHLGTRNHADIVALVRALEGMPLAIELAAARIRSFAPREMAQRLHPGGSAGGAAGSTPGLDLLARGGPRAGLDARHASMLRTIEWSWNLLGAEEQALLCGLTIFRGGCTAAAVRALASGADHGPANGAAETEASAPSDADAGAPAGADAAADAAAITDAGAGSCASADAEADADTVHLRLDALVAHSLVAAPLAHAVPAAAPAHPADEDGEGAGLAAPRDGSEALRFHLFEPIREFAAARLSAAAAAQWRRRHRRCLLAWAAGLPLTPDLAEVRAEMPNLEAALASAVADGEAADAVQLLLRLRRVLEDVELPATAMVHAEAAVAQCADPVLKSCGQSLLGPLLLLAGRGDAALAAAQAGLASAPARPTLRARALHALARVRWRSLRDAALTLPLIDEAEPLAQATGDQELQAGLLALRAFVCNRSEGNHARAYALHEQALVLWQRHGNRHAVHSGLYNLAVTQQLARRNEAALLLLARLADSARELNDWRRLSQAANVAGNALCDQRRWPEALQALRQALRLAWRTMSPYELAYPLWNLPRALAHLRQPERGLQLAAFAAAYWQRGFGRLTAADERDLLRVRRLAARQIDGRRIEAAWALGATLELSAAVALALAD
jgi:predicted ATPase/tetratricopeptide (TPR) repeat protein